MTPAVVCVPWRGGSPSREAIWSQVRAGFEGFGWPVVTGDGPADLPFNRSAARNAAADLAVSLHDPLALVFLDADTYVPLPQVYEAAGAAVKSGGVCLPYTRIKALNPVTNETQERVQLGNVPYITSGNVAVSRAAWQTLRWDERLCDWGWEDGAFLRAASLLVPVASVYGTLVTFDHARTPSEEHDISKHVRPAVLAEYDEARTPEDMRALMGRLRGA